MFPPGPRGRALLGSLPEVRRDPLEFLSRVTAEYGDIAHFKLGPLHVFLLSHPDDIEQVLVTHQHRFIKGQSLSGARRLFGNGLLTSDGALHGCQRRLVQPVFHRPRLEEYAHVMTTLAVEWRDTLSEGNTLDIAGEMSRLTLRITGRILFGADGDAVAAELRDALETATTLLEVPVLPFAALTDRLPLPHVRRFRAARVTIDRVVNDLVACRRRNPGNRGDVVSLLLSAQRETDGKPMSDVQLRDEIVTLLLASHETTANALAWTWYLLARHADAEARLHTEIDAVLRTADRPHASDVSELRYTRMVLAESMRLYPPAWLIARVAVEEHEAAGYAIPVGSLVVLSPWAVHRNKSYFPDPERFDPERWRDATQNGLPRFSYFPFGGGSRGCMGEAFAWMEGVLLLAVIARRWRFRLLDESSHPAIRPALTLMPRSGIPVRIAQRRTRE